MDKPLTDAVLKYGQPDTAFDMGDGRRAFTWNYRGGVVMPGSAYTTGTAIGNVYYGTTIFSPPTVSTFNCAYTVFARRVRTDVEGPAAWMIVGYQKPDLLCE